MNADRTGPIKKKYNEIEQNFVDHDPYDIWRTNDKEEVMKSQKLEDILGNKNNLWILKHENELNQKIATNKK